MHRIDAEMEFRKLLMMLATGIAPAGEGEPVEQPTRVFRVEMPNGYGPYNSGLDGDTGEIYRVICSKKPGYGCANMARLNHEQMGITEDEFLQAHGKAHYGCDSIKSVENWFGNKAREYLRDEWGAKLIEYEIPEGEYLLTVGHGEIIFNRDTSKRVCEYDLVSFQ